VSPGLVHTKSPEFRGHHEFRSSGGTIPNSEKLSIVSQELHEHPQVLRLLNRAYAGRAEVFGLGAISRKWGPRRTLLEGLGPLRENAIPSISTSNSGRHTSAVT
jgi:hypothetical protein